MLQEEREVFRGPRSPSIEGRRIRQAAQFSGEQLIEVNKVAVVYQAEHPNFTGDLAQVLGQTEKQQKKISNALAIINQLDVLGVDLSTVTRVSVAEDPNDTIELGRTGEGGHPQWYEIERDSSGDASARVHRSVRRAKEYGRRVNIQREQQEAERQINEEKVRELSRIEDELMDNDRDHTEQSLRYDHLRIVLREDGIVSITYREGTVNPFKPVNRSTGEYEEGSSWFRLAPFSRQQFKYVDFLARKMEGEGVVWEPRKLTEEEYLDIYMKAIVSGLLKVVRAEDGSVVFKYQTEPRLEYFVNPSMYLGVRYADIDLDTGELDISSKSEFFPLKYPPRHLNLHFLEFLRERKIQLEAGAI